MAGKKENGTANLVPLPQRTKEEQREIARKGGIKSGQTRRRQKEAKQILNYIDRQPVPAEQAPTYGEILKIDDPTFRDAIFATIYLKCLAGDMRAVELYLKLKGEMPKDIELKAGDKSMTIIWNEKRYGTDEETE